MYNETFMRRAISLSREALDKPGTEPFGAVVVQDGQIVGEGLNHAAARFDPTSHGEVEAIRDACRRLQTTDLSRCDLYTSCEPCSLCVAALHIVGIRRLYYAATLTQSRDATASIPLHIRRSDNANHLRIQVGLPIDERVMPAAQHLGNEAIRIVEAWAATRVGAEGPAI